MIIESTATALYLGFTLLVIILLAVDFFVLTIHGAHRVSAREAAHLAALAGLPASSASRGVSRLLTRALPRVQVVEFEGLGHMGPVTHPDIVYEAISSFLERG